MISDDKRFQKAFLEEAQELLESLNENLLELEKYPEDQDIINEIFRLTHSIKGEAALVGFEKISQLAHKMEDIFDKIRNAQLLVNTDIINHLYIAFDRMLEIMGSIQNGNGESLFEIEDVIISLTKILKSDNESDNLINADEVKQESAKITVDHKEVNFEFNDHQLNQIENELAQGKTFYKLTFSIDSDCEMKYPRAYLVYNNFFSICEVIHTIPDILTDADDSKYTYVEIYVMSDLDEKILISQADVDQINNIKIYQIDYETLKDKGINIEEDENSIDTNKNTDTILSKAEIDEGELIEKEWERQIKKEMKEKGLLVEDGLGQLQQEIKEKRKKSATAAKTSKQQLLKKQTIRVDIDRLDNLMNLVGELIINHSRFLQIKNRFNDAASIQVLRNEIEDAINELERISDQMQSGMMHVRMVPISTVFSKFPRMVRDLANTLNKKVNIVIEGEETEIDRAIIELITEPLTHIIRNAIDHGIEIPEERQRKGKPSDGIILLKAYQQGSNIYIEISDDGKGISVEKVKERALKLSLATMQWIDEMTREEILNIIFEPGFSTKEEITGLSGRGVGMDVVKNQVQKLRGNINLETELGTGTKITIILPLTLTIVESLLVYVNNNIFAIPVNVIEETIKIRKDEIKDFDEYKVYDLRDETIAILYLYELLGLTHLEYKDEVFIVVVSYKRRRIGLVVDELIGSQDIVIKALDESLKMLEGISGATVLGDGKIAIILDITNLVKSRTKEINKAANKAFRFYEEEEKDIKKFYDKLNKTTLDENKLDNKEYKNKHDSAILEDIDSENKNIENINNKNSDTEVKDSQNEKKKENIGLLKKAEKIKNKG